ncbi:hypothetical protein ACPB9J_33455 [Streptomyces lavendulocolor]|uniref:hypothetical protein n=1 Tax=Streptomyces lavendulocolor TaxID=67316 RepID=UPI003C2D904A
MTNPALTAAGFTARAIEREQQQFAVEAQRLADHAAHIAANPPTRQRSVSGDLTHLIQEATLLLRRGVTIEASVEALGLMEAEADTPAPLTTTDQ